MSQSASETEYFRACCALLEKTDGKGCWIVISTYCHASTFLTKNYFNVHLNTILIPMLYMYQSSHTDCFYCKQWLHLCHIFLWAFVTSICTHTCTNKGLYACTKSSPLKCSLRQWRQRQRYFRYKNGRIITLSHTQHWKQLWWCTPSSRPTSAWQRFKNGQNPLHLKLSQWLKHILRTH